MKSIIRLIVCLLLLVGWGLAALSLHVIRTSDEIPVTLITKQNLGITDTYVDTRAWTLDDVSRHPALVQKLVASGKADVLRHVVTDPKAGDVASQLSDAIQRGPTTKSGPSIVSPAKATQPATASHGGHGFLGLF